MLTVPGKQINPRILTACTKVKPEESNTQEIGNRDRFRNKEQQTILNN